jgi:hypothetical protein
MGFAWLENNTKLNGPSKAQYMELEQINLSIQMFATFYVFFWPILDIHHVDRQL